MFSDSDSDSSEGISDGRKSRVESCSKSKSESGDFVWITAPLPDHMARTWERLGWREEDGGN